MAKPPADIEVINVPNLLKLKASAAGGISEPKAVAAGDTVIDGKRAAYLEWAKEDLVEINRLLAEMRTNPDQLFDSHNPFYRKLQDIRGQGGTFGYSLLSQVGDILCGYLDTIGKGVADQGVIMMHLEVMRLILGREISGPGGPTEREMLDGLKRVVTKALALRKQQARDG